MHPRNIFKGGVKFSELAEKYEFFKPFVIKDEETGKCSLNFDDREALRALNKAILLEYYNLDVNIPVDCLIPRIPLRVNYIHWVEDLLQQIHRNESSLEPVVGLDIGTGPCAIYALLAARMNNWNMYGTDINERSIACAVQNIEKNSLQDRVKVFQVHPNSFFTEVYEKAGSSFDFSMCNPPFFSDTKDVLLRSDRSEISWEDKSLVEQEIICKGGEVNFIIEMIKESRKHQVVKIFTTMVGVKKHLTAVIKYLKEVGLKNFTTTIFHQGRISRWGLAWSWDESLHLDGTVVKPKKPARFEATFSDIPSYSDFQEKLIQILKSLEMNVKKVNSDTFEVQVERNTWSHARRKRRMQLRENLPKTEGLPSSAEVLSPSPSTFIQSSEEASIKAKVPRLSSHDNDNGLKSTQSSVTTSTDSSLNKQSSSKQESSTTETITTSEHNNSNPRGVQCGLNFKLSTCRQASDVLLRLQYLSGDLGADGVHQILQYLKNHLVT